MTRGWLRKVEQRNRRSGSSVVATFSAVGEFVKVRPTNIFILKR